MCLWGCVLKETRTGCQMPWSESYRWATQYGCCGLEAGPPDSAAGTFNCHYLSSPILYYSLMTAKVCLLSDVNDVDFYNVSQLWCLLFICGFEAFVKHYYFRFDFAMHVCCFPCLGELMKFFQGWPYLISSDTMCVWRGTGFHNPQHMFRQQRTTPRSWFSPFTWLRPNHPHCWCMLWTLGGPRASRWFSLL